MERSNRKVYRGTVVSDKMDKTITVIVETKKTHPLYGKRVKYSKKLASNQSPKKFCEISKSLGLKEIPVFP